LQWSRFIGAAKVQRCSKCAHRWMLLFFGAELVLRFSRGADCAGEGAVVQRSRFIGAVQQRCRGADMEVLSD
jgi:hypothetical protein